MNIALYFLALLTQHYSKSKANMSRSKSNASLVNTKIMETYSSLVFIRKLNTVALLFLLFFLCIGMNIFHVGEFFFFF